MIEVMQAYVDGKEIEVSYMGDETHKWKSIPVPSWDWQGYEYRVKPEPKEYWLVGGKICPNLITAHVYRDYARLEGKDREIVHVREVTK